MTLLLNRAEQLDPAVVGSRAHGAKWREKLRAAGLTPKAATDTYREAIASRYRFGGFGPAVRALADQWLSMQARYDHH